MKRKNTVLVLLMVAALCAMAVAQEKFNYPRTAKGSHTDDYHGTTVADPYRWLEDDNSPETTKWVEEQNRVTFAYLEKIPYRQAIKERLEKLYNYPKIGAPFRRGEYYYFSKNDGLQNQSVIYRQKGLEGTPEVLLDPNKFSADGTSVLSTFSLSKDGKYVVYGISKGGSDWRELHVMEVATRKALPDLVKWVKVSGASWQGDGFYYSRYPEPEKGKELSTKNENHQVYYHKVGTPQSADELVYEDRANPLRFHNAFTNEGERFAFLNISDRSKGKKGNAIFYRDNLKGEKTFTPIVAEVGDYNFGVVDNVGDKFLLFTNKNAPNGKVVLFDPQNPEEKNWKDVLPEKPETLQNVTTAGGKMFVTYLKDVTTRAYVYSLAGKLYTEVALPGPGTAGGFGGNRDDKFVFYNFTSFIYPGTIFKYDIATKKSALFRAPQIDFNSADYETRQVFYPGKDGTKVPMFITHRKGLKLDGSNPTLLYAYGGFNISQRPGFNVMLLPFLEQGGVYALANIRGGGEYGEKWHEAAVKEKRQTAFDDFIAAGEYLIAAKYTSSQKLAIRGGSNGGLLMGVVMNQRPELFKAVITQAGVMDMLRFHKFTIGWNWIAEFGSSDNAADFKYLYAYSPVHNIKQGVKYPATLITTADHDDRVVPAHSFKYAAMLQEKNAGNNPMLIRIETKSGHGASNTAKNIEIMADIYAFLFRNLGITPHYGEMTGSK
ncbi:MAG: prolyl oligopeptidase family serine peptidase [Blastocatellia bacterium]|nr:prolyl oligopeptidase family serine peptidase [Blastocatellia bacterium]